MNNELKCAFSGHRIIRITNELSEVLKNRLISLINDGVTVFINGGALGFDMFCAFEILKLKKEYPIKLKMVIPCKDQNRKWTVSQRKMYDEIIDGADEVIYLKDTYEPGCMQMRNRLMVEECDTLVSYCKKNSGGTFYTVNYAKKLGKEIIEITDLLFE